MPGCPLTARSRVPAVVPEARAAAGAHHPHRREGVPRAHWCPRLLRTAHLSAGLARRRTRTWPPRVHTRTRRRRVCRLGRLPRRVQHRGFFLPKNQAGLTDELKNACSVDSGVIGQTPARGLPEPPAQPRACPAARSGPVQRRAWSLEPQAGICSRSRRFPRWMSEGLSSSPFSPR